MGTKRDYELAARAIKRARDQLGGRTLPVEPVLLKVACCFADEFAASNNKFDRTRFLRACSILITEAKGD